MGMIQNTFDSLEKVGKRGSITTLESRPTGAMAKRYASESENMFNPRGSCGNQIQEHTIDTETSDEKNCFCLCSI